MHKSVKIALLPLIFALGAPPLYAPAREAAGDPPRYLKLHPALTVNLAAAEGSRFLRVETQIMSRDEATLQLARQHMPALRHALILLFSEQAPAAVRSIEGKERLRREALQALNGVLERETGETPIEAVYFTSMVVQ